jgi:uncharacterized membrane protein
MYQVLLYLHVMSAVTWVGGALTMQVLAVRVGGSDDPAELPRFTRSVEFVGSRVFVPAAVLLLLSGAAMTVQAWSFGQLWIALAVALWVLSAAAGAVYLAPRAARVARLLDDEGPGSVAARDLMGRIFFVSRLELAAFAVVVALMVFKPGS